MDEQKRPLPVPTESSTNETTAGRPEGCADPEGKAAVIAEGGGESFAHSPEPGDITIWRYMDLAKFVMFLREGLWFSRVDCLGDPWEAFARVVGYSPPPQPNPAQEIHQTLTAHYKEQLKSIYRHLFVNCWHKNPHESAAMWKIYGKNSGVAVRSTTERLTNSFKSPPIRGGLFRYCGAVRYEAHVELDRQVNIDFNETSPFDIFARVQPAFLKRSFFTDEREWRAVLYVEAGFDEKRTYLAIDHSVLGEGVYVDPTADQPHRSAVEEIIAQFKPTLNLRTSELARKRPPAE
jgi:hypothetical protein